MKFSKLGVLALFAPLVSALSFSPLSSGTYGSGASIDIDVSLGGTSPGSYPFVLYCDGVFVEVLETVDVLVDGVVSLLLPGGLEGSGYTIGCCPTANDYYNPFTVSEPFNCE